MTYVMSNSVLPTTMCIQTMIVFTKKIRNVYLLHVRGIVNKFPDCVCKNVKTWQKLMKISDKNSTVFYQFCGKEDFISKVARRF